MIILQCHVVDLTLSSVLMGVVCHGMPDVMESRIVLAVMMKMRLCASGLSLQHAQVAEHTIPLHVLCIFVKVSVTTYK